MAKSCYHVMVSAVRSSFIDFVQILFNNHFCNFVQLKTKFLDWYLKIGVASALVGASMEFFMVKTGFYDKVTVLESEKRALENSPEAQAIREALNPWRHVDTKETNKP
ncbi:hypothetical protein MTR_1g068580 [Medicago truncatula]|uniref:Uncharacterized protein n=1 Tax=Medicago truncatula TaxID=3880 RepID=G7IBM1_MEDTR|nr:hypothetical protein MTR_1g068580 [Medicago truncatula]